MSYHKNFDAYEEERLGGNLLVRQNRVLLRFILINMQKSVFR